MSAATKSQALFRLHSRTGVLWDREGRAVGDALSWRELEQFQNGVREAYLTLGQILPGPIIEPDDIERWDRAQAR